MCYFTDITKQSFKTAPTGERVFYRSGPWSRPYIIPDRVTEQQLYSKQVWIHRWLWGPLLFGQSFLFAIRPQMLHEPHSFLVYLAFLCFGSWLIEFMVFRRDLRSLSRYSTRLPLRNFYAQSSSHHSTMRLLVGFLVSLIFVAVGFWILLDGQSIALAIVCIGISSFTSFAWGYQLYLKLR